MKRITFALIFLLSVFSIYGCDNSDRLKNDHEHTASSWIVEKEPTCTENGTQVRKCTTCSQLLETEEISKISHVGQWHVVTEANCEHEGLSENICINCNKTLGSKKIPMHNTVYQNAVEPTCTTSGLTKGSYCKDCGMVFEEQTFINATGHNYQTISAIQPTCANYGWTEGEKCTLCGDVKITPEKISKTDHQFVDLSALEPTCTEEGRESGGKICTVCNEKQYQTIPALGHAYDLITGECSRCNSTEHIKYTSWDTFLNNYSDKSSFILDIRNMEFNSSKDYVIKLLPYQKYIRVIGDENTVYTNIFFVINARSDEISIDFVNVKIQNQSQVSKTAIIESLSNCTINIGFYGNACELSGMNGKNGKSGTITDLSISNGDDGNAAIDASAGSLNIFCSAPSVKINGGNGGDGGGNPNDVADGGNGSCAIIATSINVKFASGFSKSNISITGGEGGVGGYTVVWFAAKEGTPGDDASPANVEIKYN